MKWFLPACHIELRAMAPKYIFIIINHKMIAMYAYAGINNMMHTRLTSRSCTKASTHNTPSSTVAAGLPVTSLATSSYLSSRILGSLDPPGAKDLTASSDNRINML